MLKRLLFLFVLLTGILVIYFISPSTKELPNLGKVEGVKLNQYMGDKYSFSDNKIKLVTFFYTNCPDVCPSTMADLSLLKRELEKQNLYQSKVQLIAITLDPETDTDERLNLYAESYGIDHKGWLLLRGSDQETKTVASKFNMIYKKDKSGFITHRTTMYLLDSSNVIRARFDMATGNKRVNIEEIISHINRL